MYNKTFMDNLVDAIIKSSGRCMLYVLIKTTSSSMYVRAYWKRDNDIIEITDIITDTYNPLRIPKGGLNAYDYTNDKLLAKIKELTHNEIFTTDYTYIDATY